ncbi:NAD(P)-dependent oxidoreductase [Roseibium sp. MMSF_3544]|uniref:NAD(P)-dependent oxidoreductase n=1 Tax=unclassified Roseibium TaxID=2629323 RepID=UPI00273F5DD0|nr:NAD(P)-dependent oxidoreductase [Roseibium sp. MMSF_3544]
MLMLRSPLQPQEITDEIRARFDTRDEAAALADPSRITAVATKGDIGLPADLMARLPALQMIAVYGVGVDRIDLDQARDREIAVTTTPGVLTDAVAEHALALLLSAARRIVAGDAHVRTGAWAKAKLDLGFGLKGKTVGILGYGRIGRRIAELARGFGMTVIYSDLAAVPGEEAGYRASPEALARDADVLIVAAAGGDGTNGLVGADVLRALGPDGMLINVARGSIVDEEALISALGNGEVGGAALDVFQDEPSPRHEIMDLPNTIVTPHVSSATTDARRAMGRLVIDNLAAFFDGRPLVTPLEVKK